MKQKVSRVTFNKRAKVIQFWIPESPYVREYPLTSRNQMRIERCLNPFDWHLQGIQSMTIYTRRRQDID